MVAPPCSAPGDPPALLVCGLLFGWFGPTELAAFTVFYSLFLGAVIYQELTWDRLLAGARETVRATAIIMFIVSSAAIFAWVLTVEQVPAQMSELMLGFSKDPVVLLLLTNVILLIVGMFMESIAAIMVMTPLLIPPLYAAGMDPVHLGVVVVLNLMIGLLSNVSFSRMARVIWPFLVPLLVSLLIVTLVPSISTWLPALMFRK